MANLKTDFCGMELENPTILASGILGVSAGTLKIAAHGGAGAVTIKSISIEPRTGHKNPSVIAFETGLMNAVGYSNAGLENAKEEFANLKEIAVPVIGSAIGKTAEEFAEVVSVFDEMDFDAVEIPLSCPHTPDYGTLAGHSSPEKTAEITKACRKTTKKPLIVKFPRFCTLTVKGCEFTIVNGFSSTSGSHSIKNCPGCEHTHASNSKVLTS